MFRLTPVVKVLLIINAVLFFITAGGSAFAEYLFGSLALYPLTSENFRIWQVVTHFFMHGGFAHFFFNMFALVMFGSALESVWGGRKFIFYYVFCAFGAAALHMGVDYWQLWQVKQSIADFVAVPTYGTFKDYMELVPFERFNKGYHEGMLNIADQLDHGVNINVEQTADYMRQYVTLAENGIPMVGASGAIFGLLVAFGMLFQEAELMLLFLPIPVKAKYFIPVLMVIELYLGTNNFAWDNIAHFAHLGGALFGILLLLYWQKYGSRL